MASVIAGGCVAAAGGVRPSALASWAAAYLVLVSGVAQAFLGKGQAVIAVPSVSMARRRSELACWNLGNIAVLLGVLIPSEASLLGGSTLLLVALGLFALSTRERAGGPAWLQLGYRILLILLAVSVPAGVLLARTL